MILFIRLKHLRMAAKLASRKVLFGLVIAVAVYLMPTVHFHKPCAAPFRQKQPVLGAVLEVWGILL